MKPTRFEDVTIRELEQHPDIDLSFEHRAKAKAAVLSLNGKSLRVFYPKTPSDSQRGARNHLKNLRHVIEQLKGT